MSGDKHNLRVGDYLEHIVTAIEKINRYTKNMDRQGFLDDEKTLDAVAKKLGVSRVVVTFAWLMRHPSGIVPLVGSVNPARIKEAATADGIEISREDWYRIYIAARGEGMP